MNCTNNTKKCIALGSKQEHGCLPVGIPGPTCGKDTQKNASGQGGAGASPEPPSLKGCANGAFFLLGLAVFAAVLCGGFLGAAAGVAVVAFRFFTGG